MSSGSGIRLHTTVRDKLGMHQFALYAAYTSHFLDKIVSLFGSSPP